MQMPALPHSLQALVLPVCVLTLPLMRTVWAPLALLTPPSGSAVAGLAHLLLVLACLLCLLGVCLLLVLSLLLNCPCMFEKAVAMMRALTP